MKNKTYKLKKLESNRFSILTDELDTCFICKMSALHLHEIFEGSKRIASIRNGLVIPVCWNCHTILHNKRDVALKYKQLAQQKFEETHTREDFMKEIMRNYL